MFISEHAAKVKQALETYGIETPMQKSFISKDEQKAEIKQHFKQIMQILGLDLTDDSLAETPQRMAKMYIDEIFSGMDYINFPKITLIDNKMHADEMICVKDISLTSTCEHHLVTIDGSACVAYIPKNKIIGLSKINRIVRFFATRPQVQERLTNQVLIALQTLLETDDVAIVINATHYCVKARGVMDATSSTTTNAFSGKFKTDATTRQEFLHSIK